ncbi:carbohydrate ABC transporter permease [Natronosporangium hydrolyticum]|uniref:Carbohydrate ABC transporter permease n=1 Tax=Natronosporangium hydrolyticum TaxID=2811111 RepID=A0A895Y7M6_9ACTN|nr:carbohydrate ABC transporter permease [Natronosporangium hydrolyticum]QSB13717.1 carbohydrate ABC transporter permease [Natronosporangium hydrolyticum]
MTFVDTRVPELRPAGTTPVGPPKPSLGTRLARRLGGVASQVALLTITLIWMLPTLGLAIASLRSTADNSATGWWTALTRPSQLTVDNYVALLGNETILRSLWNTVLITVPATVLVVVIGSFAAYALAWLEFRGRDWLFVVLVALIVVPVQVAIIPNARLFGLLGIYGHVAGVVAFHVAFGLPLAVFLLRNFFRQIPRDLIEAARLDGGTEAAVFRRVVLPLSGPAIASLAIFQFLWVWNDLLVALVFATSENAPITYALREQMRAFSSNIDVIGPGAFVSMTVPLIVFFAFQRYFVHGVLAGSTK